MRNMQFVPNFRILDAIAQTSRSAGSSDLNGKAIDCQNDACIVALVEMAAITAGAVTSLKWQGSDDNTTFVDLDGMSVSVAADQDNEYFVLELHKPLNRYNRLVVERSTQNAAIRSAQYILGGPRKAPTFVDGDAGSGDGYGDTYTLAQFIGGQGAA